MTSECAVYENGDLIDFKVDYQSEIVKFNNGTVFGKQNMYLLHLM